MKRIVIALALTLLAPLLPAVAHAESGDRADVWVHFRDKADLTAAASIVDWSERGRHVLAALQDTANRSQRGVRQKLARQGVAFESFWAANAIYVRSADRATTRALAARAEVARVRAPQTVQLEIPRVTSTLSSAAGPEWGVASVRAPEVWQQYGRGENIVVGSVDSGVQFDHPALARQYRGHGASHDYNWYDPARVCSASGAVPCDNTGHGTHTVGTMVGDDGAGNEIGVAPAARWIAAKGCESNSCTDFALISSGQWMLAPTTVDGANPRPDMRPHVINNSWGAPSATGFYREVVQAWVAAGIFPVFSAGNSGPRCETHGEPGSLPEAYAVAAHDVSGQIAYFSSRGPSAQADDVKPDIGAPGVAVRSSLPGSSYGLLDGTSMAAPHVTGVVALLLSIAPSLSGDVAGIRALLDSTASDVDDRSCGGTAANNHVWGEGRVDALTAASRAPVTPRGAISGVVADDRGTALAGAVVTVQIGEWTLRALSDAAGAYRLGGVPVGERTVAVRAFGYASASRVVVVAADASVGADFALPAVARHPVTGIARDDGGRVLAGVNVRLSGTPLAPVTTDAAGRFAIDAVPVGEYVVVGSGDACLSSGTAAITVAAATDVALTVPRRRDRFGYTCKVENGQWIAGATKTGVGGLQGGQRVELPFPVTYYGHEYTWLGVAVNGFASFEGLLGSIDPNDLFPMPFPIPFTWYPNAALQVFWDDLVIDDRAGVYTATVGAAPHRTFVIEWRDVLVGNDGVERRASFEILLHEDGRITYQYESVDSSRERGASAGIGIENRDGTDGLQFTIRRDSLRSGMAITFDPGPRGTVAGTVTDRNDGKPLAAARVELRRADGTAVVTASSDAVGRYVLQAPPGSYTVHFGVGNYGPVETAVSVVDGGRHGADAALATGVAVVSAASVEPVLTAGQTRQQAVRITNTGSRPLSWEAHESASPVHGYPGDVLGRWPASGVDQPYGIGLTPTSVWVSDATVNRVVEYDRSGRATGRAWELGWLTRWTELGDMAYDPGRGVMCQAVALGDGTGYGDGITCWNPETGAFAGHTRVDVFDLQPRALAYRPDDDTFYVADWRMVSLVRVAGFSHPEPGKVLGSCIHDEYPGGLAWNPRTERLWMANNQTVPDTIVEIDPETCRISQRLPNPNPPYQGGALDLADDGTLWTVGRRDRAVYRLANGAPEPADVPWLSLGAGASGTLAPGESATVRVGVSGNGLSLGRNEASVLIRTDAGRVPLHQIAVRPMLTDYRLAIDAGGTGHASVVDGEPWVADPLGGRGASTKAPISGTDDDALFQTARTGPASYRLAGLPDGTYLVELGFAEIEGRRPGKRLFDVYAAGTRVAYALDVAGEFGQNTAGWRTATVTVTGGVLTVDVVARTGQPLVNAIRVTRLP